MSGHSGASRWLTFVLHCRAAICDVAGQAQGVPLYAVEAANWLRGKGLVAEGGQLSASADLAAAIPPSLQNIVQLEVDALPPGPGAVLRCASVLGSPLSQDMLLELVPRAVATCEEALGVELELLEAYGMLYRVAAESVPLATEGAGSTAEEASDGTGSRGGGGFWAFRHQLHCDVVYRSIAHVHRRSLHRRAALLLGKRLVAAPEQPQARQLLWEQARHLEKVLLCHSAGHSYGVWEKGDINALARVLESMASHAEATGCWKEAYDHRSRLLGILQEIFCGKPTVWQCRMELHAVQQLLGAITRAADNGIAVCTEQRRAPPPLRLLPLSASSCSFLFLCGPMYKHTATRLQVHSYYLRSTPPQKENVFIRISVEGTTAFLRIFLLLF